MQNHLEKANPHLATAQAAMRARHAKASAGPHPNEPYSIGDLMRLHGLSRHTVIGLYENEPGVLIHENIKRQKSGVRRHRVIRVPCHVYQRMVRKMEVK